MREPRDVSAAGENWRLSPAACSPAGCADEVDFYAINVACLDEVMPETLAQALIPFEDGRHWESTPAETRLSR
jgi:hypothetical protein